MVGCACSSSGSRWGEDQTSNHDGRGDGCDCRNGVGVSPRPVVVRAEAEWCPVTIVLCAREGCSEEIMLLPRTPPCNLFKTFSVAKQIDTVWRYARHYAGSLDWRLRPDTSAGWFLFRDLFCGDAAHDGVFHLLAPLLSGVLKVTRSAAVLTFAFTFTIPRHLETSSSLHLHTSSKL